jgi:hypothetical protein
MDEIICPECGRPNLIEAEKCWYCQVPLVEKEDQSNDSDDENEANTGQQLDASLDKKSAGTEENEENLPEWLKRIRQLKKADTPVEEVDEWQQEKLFPGLTQEADKTANHTETSNRPQKLNESPEPKLVIPEGQPLLEEVPAEEILEEKDLPVDEGMPEEVILPDVEEPDDSENELPEGFTPLEL